MLRGYIVSSVADFHAVEVRRNFGGNRVDACLAGLQEMHRALNTAFEELYKRIGVDQVISKSISRLRRPGLALSNRRDILLFNAGAAAALNFRGMEFHMALRATKSNEDASGRARRINDLTAFSTEWMLKKALRIDDDVAEVLYSGNRMVPTYTKSQIVFTT